MATADWARNPERPGLSRSASLYSPFVIAHPTRPAVRLAELVATLSLGTDLGLGQPMEHVIRQTLIALRMSEHLGLDEAERVVVYYSGLLAWVGCHTDAYEQAKWFGDDLRLKADGFLVDDTGPAWLLANLGAGQPLLQRIRRGIELPLAMRRGPVVDLEAHWLTTDAMARRLGLGEDVRQSLKESYERWDGKGAFGAKGEEIMLASRLIYLADVVAVFQRAGGLDAAVAVARERRGTSFDPALVDLFCANAPALLGDLDDATTWDAVLAAEPQLERMIPDDRFDDVLEAVGDFTDLKSPFTIGHVRGVAELAAEAAHRLRDHGPRHDRVHGRARHLVGPSRARSRTRTGRSLPTRMEERTRSATLATRVHAGDRASQSQLGSARGGPWCT